MQIQIPTDPVILSIICGTIALVVSMLVLGIAKPNMVTKLSDSGKKKIDWFKMIMISIMIDISVSICTFLVLVKDRKIEYKSAKMGMNPQY